MKYSIVILILFLVCLVNLYTQNVSFTGINGFDFSAVKLDSVKIIYKNSNTTKTFTNTSIVNLKSLIFIEKQDSMNLIELNNFICTETSLSFPFKNSRISTITVYVYDVNGIELSNKVFWLDAGIYQLTIPVNQLSLGLYFVKIQSQYSSFTKSIQKLSNNRIKDGLLSDIKISKLSEPIIESNDEFIFIGYAKNFYTDTLFATDPADSSRFNFLLYPKGGYNFRTFKLYISCKALIETISRTKWGSSTKYDTTIFKRIFQFSNRKPAYKSECDTSHYPGSINIQYCGTYGSGIDIGFKADFNTSSRQLTDLDYFYENDYYEYDMHHYIRENFKIPSIQCDTLNENYAIIKSKSIVYQYSDTQLWQGSPPYTNFDIRLIKFLDDPNATFNITLSWE